MKKIAAFMQLVRWPNLFFIVFTQTLYYYCIVVPVLNVRPDPVFVLLIVAASVFIAAAGYIINDYFDLNIDQINKPQKIVLNKVISRRWAIIWHGGLSVLGLVCTAFAVGISNWYLVAGNIAAVVLLWVYSTSLKKQLLIGNVLIALLTAWTILIVFFYQSGIASFFRAQAANQNFFAKISFLYAAFAFITTLIRESVKDAEDMEGDRKYKCQTLPIKYGLPAARLYNAIWLVVLLVSILFLEVYVLRFGWWGLILYNLAFIIVPLFLVFRRNLSAATKADFARLSAKMKWVMLAGIASMAVFSIYF